MIEMIKITRFIKISETQFKLVTRERIYQLETVQDGPPMMYWLEGFEEWLEFLNERSEDQSDGSFHSEHVDKKDTSNVSSKMDSSISLSSTNLRSSSVSVTSQSSTNSLSHRDSVTSPSPTSSRDSTKTPIVPVSKTTFRLSSRESSKESFKPKETPALHESQIKDLSDSLQSKDKELAQLRMQLQEAERKIKTLSTTGTVATNAITGPPNRQSLLMNTRKRDESFWRLIQEDNSVALDALITSTCLDMTTKTFYMSPLHFAILSGSVNVIKTLLKYGPRNQLDEPDPLGQTPLLYAIEKQTGEDSAEIVQSLLNHSANAEFADVSENGLSGLHAACFIGNERVVQMLLRAGADPHKVDGRLGWTTLHWAVAGGCVGIVKVLLDKGVKSTKVNGVSPLDIATDNNNTPLIDMLKSTLFKQ